MSESPPCEHRWMAHFLHAHVEHEGDQVTTVRSQELRLFCEKCGMEATPDRLERVTELQRRIIKLESENARLRGFIRPEILRIKALFDETINKVLRQVSGWETDPHDA